MCRLIVFIIVASSAWLGAADNASAQRARGLEPGSLQYGIGLDATGMMGLDGSDGDEMLDHGYFAVGPRMTVQRRLSRFFAVQAETGVLFAAAGGRSDDSALSDKVDDPYWIPFIGSVRVLVPDEDETPLASLNLGFGVDFMRLPPAYRGASDDAPWETVANLMPINWGISSAGPGFNFGCRGAPTFSVGVVDAWNVRFGCTFSYDGDLL